MTAITELAGSADLLAEAASLLPAMVAARPRAAGPEGARNAIGQALAVFHVPEETQTVEWWSLYITALKDTPLRALEAALHAYIAKPDSEFMPKPGAWLALAKRVQLPELTAIQRVKDALRERERRAPRAR